MTVDRATYYGGMADRKERDPIIVPGEHGRAEVANGSRFKTWVKFNRSEDLVWVQTMDGRMVGLTPWQNKVYQLGRTYIDTGTVTIRAMAKILGCAPSTVSRALTKLQSWGLFGVLRGRGRYAGAVIFRMYKGDPFQRFRDAAKAKVREWSKAQSERANRVAVNVATFILDVRDGVDGYYYWARYVTRSTDATLNQWTRDEILEALGEM